jgi:hypothetical protein
MGVLRGAWDHVAEAVKHKFRLQAMVPPPCIIRTRWLTLVVVVLRVCYVLSINHVLNSCARSVRSRGSGDRPESGSSMRHRRGDDEEEYRRRRRLQREEQRGSRRNLPSPEPIVRRGRHPAGRY